MPENVNSGLPCAYCGEMPSEGDTIIHKSGESTCPVAGVVFTKEHWNNRPGEDAARLKQFEEDCKAVKGLRNYSTNTRPLHEVQYSLENNCYEKALATLRRAWEKRHEA